MKIVIATGIFPPDIGGPATYSETLLEQLTKRGFDVSVITYSDGKNPDLKAERISRDLPRGIRHFTYFWRLLNIAKTADVIYAQDPISAGLPAMCAARILRKKFVLKIVGDYAWEQYQNGIKNPEARIIGIDEFQTKRCGTRAEILRFLEKIVAKSANKIITPSNYLKKLVTGWGVNENKIEVVYNAYTGTADSRQFINNSLKFSGDVIISVGRLVLWKGFEALIEIMQDLIKINPNFKMFIIGEGPNKKNLESRIANYDLNDKIILTGKLSHSEVLARLKAANIFVLNTAYEGLSHQLLEVLDAGVPIITTNVCGNPEVVTDSENGILVGYNDKTALKEAILKIWRDKDLARKFVINGKKTLDKFVLEKMIEQTINVLKK